MHLSAAFDSRYALPGYSLDYLDSRVWLKMSGTVLKNGLGSESGSHKKSDLKQATPVRFFPEVGKTYDIPVRRLIRRKSWSSQKFRSQERIW